MEEEWTALQSEDRGLPSLWGPQGLTEVGLSQSVALTDQLVTNVQNKS